MMWRRRSMQKFVGGEGRDVRDQEVSCSYSCAVLHS